MVYRAFEENLSNKHFVFMYYTRHCARYLQFEFFGEERKPGNRTGRVGIGAGVGAGTGCLSLTASTSTSTSALTVVHQRIVRHRVRETERQRDRRTDGESVGWAHCRFT